MCFLHLGPENTPEALNVLLEKGLYAVVQSFDKEVIALPPTKIIFKGCLENLLHFYHCDSINGTVAVVPDVIKELKIDNPIDAKTFFLVKNRDYWLHLFHSIMDDLTNLPHACFM